MLYVKIFEVKQAKELQHKKLPLLKLNKESNKVAKVRSNK